MDGQIITLENQQGKKQDYEVYFTFIVNDKEYIALSELKTQEVLLLEYVSDNNGQMYLEMIDEDDFEAVKQEFIEIMEE